MALKESCDHKDTKQKKGIYLEMCINNKCTLSRASGEDSGKQLLSWLDLCINGINSLAVYIKGSAE